jgi:hypothetical protein
MVPLLEDGLSFVKTKSIRVLQVGALVLVTGVLGACAHDDRVPQDPTSRDLDRRVANIDSHFGVRVHFAYNRHKFFPDEWKKPPFWARGEQVELDAALRTMRIVEMFLSKYPIAVVRANLHDISC